jgi:hypothetical protein
MSQTLVISTAGKIPDSTTVKAFRKAQIPERNRAPIGASVAEAATASGSLTLTGLPDGEQFLLAYEETGKWFYPMSVSAPAASNTGLAEVASANPLTLPNGRLIKVSGAVEIKKIAVAPMGTTVTLLFASTPKVVDGENLKLSANLEATADDTLTLVCDGTNWFEIARSVN